MNREQQLKLQAFLDGELPESEASKVLAWTQRNHEAAALLKELKNTKQAMVRSEARLKLPESREFFWSKIEREIQKEKPQATSALNVSVFALFRRWLLPVGVVATILIIGMIAHFNTPKPVVQNVAEAETPTVETTLASGDATTYRDATEGTTLVWFSDEAPATGKKPTAIN